jgi:RHS repeat-associated protein
VLDALDEARPLAASAAGQTTFYVYGRGPLAELTDEWTYYLADGNHTVRQLSDADGAITLARSYTPWGELLMQRGGGDPPWGYFGGLLDAATGLIYVGSGQYYDPRTGRFLSPIGSGRNPYVPTSPCDPLGALLGMVALAALLVPRRRRRRKRDEWLLGLMLVLAVGMSIGLAACEPTPPPDTPPQPPTTPPSPTPPPSATPTCTPTSTSTSTPTPPSGLYFHSLPVDPSQVTGLQWYGNTEFAYHNRDSLNYSGYSQGLHGGLDLIAAAGTAVQAGIYGKVVAVDPGFFGPHRVDIKSGNYRVLYGHLDNLPLELKIGDEVEPKTKVGEVSATEGHVHIEVRGAYDSAGGESNIYNPLLYMSPDMVRTLKGIEEPNFYEPAGKWLTPLDQPVIVRGGPVLIP